MDTLEKLISKSDKSGSSTWKWILGIVIGLVIVFIQWRLKHQASKIAVLEAERAMLKEKTIDLAMQLENEKNEARIGVYKSEISALQTQTAVRAVKLIGLKDDLAEKKKRIKDAKTWKKLEKEAGRR